MSTGHVLFSIKGCGYGTGAVSTVQCLKLVIIHHQTQVVAWQSVHPPTTPHPQHLDPEGGESHWHHGNYEQVSQFSCQASGLTHSASPFVSVTSGEDIYCNAGSDIEMYNYKPTSGNSANYSICLYI